MKLSNPQQKAKNITLLVLDVDGVLTDASSAVREACEFILSARGELTPLEAQYR